MLLSCVCPSQAGTVPKWLNAGSHKQRRTIGQDYSNSFLTPKTSAKFRSHPNGNAKYRWGIGSNWRFSTNISLYLKNGARQGHSCYGTPIGNRMRRVLYRMALFPVTMSDPNHPIFDILHSLSYFRIGWRQRLQI